MRSKNRKAKQRGFTLVELMAVILIIGLIAGTATIAVSKRIKKARIQSTITQISQFGQSIATFHMDCGFYPSSLDDLIREPTGGKKCRGYSPILNKKEIPQDPWKNDYNYQSPGIHAAESYDIWSNGPDGEEGTSDDITSWAVDEIDDE